MHKEQATNEERLTVEDITIKFNKKVCAMQVTLNNQSIEKFKIKFNEEKFNTNAEKALKNKGVSTLDVISVNSLYLLKLSEHLLTEVIKKSILAIDKLNSEVLLKGVDFSIINTRKEKLSLIEDKVKLANSYAEEIFVYLESKFKRINEEVENMNCNVFDRSGLIKKCKDEILDNVYKKHALVVNEIIHLAYKRDLPEDVIGDLELKNYIESFK